MPRFDLNGNPISDDPDPASPQSPSVPQLPPIPPLPVDARQPNRPYNPPPPMPDIPPMPPSAYVQPPQYQASMTQQPPVYHRSTANSRQAVDPRQAQRDYAVKWIAGGACLFVGITIAILFGHPAPVPAPAGFSPYTAANGTFTVSMPDGWNVQPVTQQPGSNGADSFAGLDDATDSGGVVFSQKSAKIAIYQGKVESITGSVLSPLPAQNLLKQEKSDVLSSQFSNISDDQDYNFTTEGFGDGASMTWSSSGSRSILPSPVHGYYVALSGGNYYVTVVCQCRESDWNALKPAFQTVINSLTELPPAGYSAPEPGGEAYPSGPPPHKEPINTTPGL